MFLVGLIRNIGNYNINELLPTTFSKQETNIIWYLNTQFNKLGIRSAPKRERVSREADHHEPWSTVA